MATDAPSAIEIERLIAGDEKTLVEFKREWPELDKAEGKAKLAKAVMALANSVPLGDTAYLILGVEDPKDGGEVVGVAAKPTPETVIQVLGAYIDPPPSVEILSAVLNGRDLSVISVVRGPAGPYAPARNHDGILRRTAMYIRRGQTVAEATPREIAELSRRWGTGGPVPIDSRSLVAGFLGGNSWNGRSAVAEVRNLGGIPISGVGALLDVVSVRHPELVLRIPSLVDATLGPGEARRLDFDWSNRTFYRSSFAADGHRDWALAKDFAGHDGDSWWNLRLLVTYRDPDGFISTITKELAVER